MGNFGRQDAYRDNQAKMPKPLQIARIVPTMPKRAIHALSADFEMYPRAIKPVIAAQNLRHGLDP